MLPYLNGHLCGYQEFNIIISIGRFYDRPARRRYKFDNIQLSNKAFLRLWLGSGEILYVIQLGYLSNFFSSDF